MWTWRVLVVVIVLMITGSCRGENVTSSRLDAALRTQLSSGDSAARIKEVLAREGIVFSYDEFQRRYQGIIRNPTKSNKLHDIVIYVYVDAGGNYERHTVEDSYTGV